MDGKRHDFSKVQHQKHIHAHPCPSPGLTAGKRRGCLTWERTGKPWEPGDKVPRRSKLRLWLSEGAERGKSDPHFILHRVWQLLVAVLYTNMGGGGGDGGGGD